MFPQSLVTRTKLTPPRQNRRTLRRPRLTRRLEQARDYRLTIVQAGPGYGKSTALAALVEEKVPVVWYLLDDDDTDPYRLLLHLFFGFQAAVPGLSQAPLVLLEEWHRQEQAVAWPVFVDALLNALVEGNSGPLFLVLDDAHRLNEANQAMRILDRLIGRAPQNLHCIVATRYPLPLPALLTWRVRDELLEVGQEELAFTPQEVTAWFRQQYGLQLLPAKADLLASRIEGWPMALQLVGQRLQKDDQASLAQVMDQLSASTGDLFTYLAHEVLEQLPADIQAFLRTTAVLAQMTAFTCDCLRHSRDSQQILDYLLERGLFVVDLGDGHVRYHHLFRDLLLRQLSPQAAQAAHRQAANCLQQIGREEEAIPHFLAAQAYQAAATLLVRLGPALLQAGRLDRVAAWISSLPPDVLAAHPPLLSYLGDVARLHSHFDEALGWYQQAEERSQALGDVPGMGQALRGQARVYLDTVNPTQAERLLQEAIRLSDGQKDRESQARLLELLAENLLNRGRLTEAQKLQRQARELRQEGPGEAELAVRLLLRMGRLEEAHRVLSERAEIERQEPVLRPRAHRETLLLLSLVHAFRGEREEAYRSALEGTERGRVLDSPFVTAVGYMRQGHAWLLRKDENGYEEAHRCFQEAIALSERLEVPRLKIEANWGLCQAYGFRADLEQARQVAEQGIELARRHGDEWVEACIRTSMGAGYALAGRQKEASDWLAQAATAFRACSDSFGETVARLWQCLIWQEQGDHVRLKRDIGELLARVRENGYEFLFLRRTLLGPPDPRRLLPMLLFARRHDQERAVANRLLAELGLAGLETHPGYQLRLQVLGAFRLWRGAQEVPPSAWRRKKARQLFLLLLTRRYQMLEREQITEILWPDQEPESARRDFKIAYSALCQVLEPARARNAPSAFIARDDSRYGLRPEADIWLDAAEMERLVQLGDAAWERERAAALAHYQAALALYQGDYLEEHRYEEWCTEERERLLTRFLRLAERVAEALLAQGAAKEAIAVCQSILERDDCWEQAYRLLMQAYARLGNRAQISRVYRRCRQRLQASLAVAPSSATTALYEELMR